MPVFSYRALDKRGAEKKGQIEADSASSARTILLGRDFYPIDITEKVIGEKKGRRGFFQTTLPSKNQVTIFTRQLATLISAGVPAARSLESIADQTDDTRLRGLILTVLEDIKGGQGLAEAFSPFPSLFPDIYTNIVRAGEESGTLDLSLNTLADFLEEQEKLTEKIKSALTYPILMLLIATLVVVFLVTFIVPRITTIFDSLGTALPLSTKILISISGFLGKAWWLLALAIIGGYVLYGKYYASSPGRERIDAIKLKIPLLGKLSICVAMERFSSTMSTLIRSGLTMEKALMISAGTTGNSVIHDRIQHLRERVVEGAPLAGTMKQEPIFPPILIQMVSVGEESGNLDFMLKKAAQAFEREYENFLERFLSLIEPVIILVMGGLVAFIVISVMLPLLNLSQILR
ncbi:MAG: hypothetical protein GTN70_03585 [Deltaproteobacteria bacterium]|nr:hypothetical protein [Deltaproteobacteria bacterium]NIS76734.1 hypothetical protein [Deltaproteobacteria bacterium]